MADRTCDRCGTRMSPYLPRKKNDDGEYLCRGCQQIEGYAARKLLEWSRRASQVVAHDSGDGERVFHCPFCGAGQQVGRSDGTIECGFCDAHYTVQVQPNHSAAPQTIDGVPHTPPEMPGEGPGKAPEEEDPFERATELELEPGEEDDGPLENDNPFTEQSDDDDDKPPFLSSRQYRVGKHVLSEDDYLRHIALKFAGSGRDRVLEAVRQSRGR